MLSIKKILIGIGVQVITFLFLFVLIVIAASKAGNVTNSGYILALEIASYVSVTLGAFTAARLAWERGLVYGLIISIFWIIVRIMTLIFLSEADVIISSPIKVLIILAIGLCAGAFGVTGRKNKII